MKKGIGVYSSSVPDRRDRLQHPGADDGYIGGNKMTKRRPVGEYVDPNPVGASRDSGALRKKP